MKHVVREGPVEILDRRQPGNTRQHLVKIDQAETEVEHARRQLALRHQHHQTNRAEEDVKQVIRRRATHQAVLIRYDEPADTSQYQQRREDRQRFLIKGHLLCGFSLRLCVFA